MCISHILFFQFCRCNNVLYIISPFRSTTFGIPGSYFFFPVSTENLLQNQIDRFHPCCDPCIQRLCVETTSYVYLPPPLLLCCSVLGNPYLISNHHDLRVRFCACDLISRPELLRLHAEHRCVGILRRFSEAAIATRYLPDPLVSSQFSNLTLRGDLISYNEDGVVLCTCVWLNHLIDPG